MEIRPLTRTELEQARARAAAELEDLRAKVPEGHPGKRKANLEAEIRMWDGILEQMRREAR